MDGLYELLKILDSEIELGLGMNFLHIDDEGECLDSEIEDVNEVLRSLCFKTHTERLVYSDN